MSDWTINLSGDERSLIMRAVEREVLRARDDRHNKAALSIWEKVGVSVGPDFTKKVKSDA